MSATGAGSQGSDTQSPTIRNRKARYEYEINDTCEAGIVLLGTEVKSLRSGKANLKDAYARIEGGEIFLCRAHISPYDGGNRYNHDPERLRKLLLHRREIRRLQIRTEQHGMTLVPLKLYFKHGYVKVELAVARGKKLYDKRRALADREMQRSVERALVEGQRE